MKHILYIFVVLLALGFIGCSPKANVTDSFDVPITDNMKLENTKTEVIQDETMTLSTYNVENSTLNTFLAEYQKVLNDDGWTTVEYNEPGFLRVQKNNNEVIIMAYEVEGKLKVDIITTPKTEE